MSACIASPAAGGRLRRREGRSASVKHRTSGIGTTKRAAPVADVGHLRMISSLMFQGRIRT